MARLSMLLLLSLLFISQNSTAQTMQNQRHYLLAQTDPDEAYDPFTDYSEFDEASDEEADVHFFKNGRFFTAALAGGYRGFTGSMASVYGSGFDYGIYVSYFFDLRLALSMGITTGDHPATLKTNINPTGYSGTASITNISFNMKYYVGSQNVTKGLADLNPYMIGGFSQVYRTQNFTGVDGYNRDNTMGVDIGAGIEIPTMRKKSFIGLQGAYHLVNFADENKNYLQGTEMLVNKIQGDYWDLMVLLGMNF